ncbi:leucine-rich repeat-containing protein 37B [Pogoniulus pusillus]|uniref:leucine-rich repeat-containing protein 37B n=1 Tax=Pogoniulus pusillus TaxID=488313 RepID=UPI0030B95B82
MGQPRPSRALLLALLLLAAVPIPARPRGRCPPLCRCHRRLLDCSRALPALVLQDNDLQAVKRHSLEGLLLLKHLDLSHNQILVIEEAAFEPLPFLQLLNLDGNLLTQLWNGTFQAWHGMQFLEKLVLSHNPLTVIADTSFFSLPSLKYLPPEATSTLQDAAEEAESSPGGHLPGIPHTAEAHRMQEKEGSSFPSKPEGSESPGRASAEGDLFEAKLQHRLRLLVPDEALRSFVARVAQALQGDCSLPQLQPACAKLLLKAGLLIKLLSQRQEEQGACVVEGNVSIGMAEEEKAMQTSSDLLLWAPAVAAVVMVNLLLICLAEVS